MKNQVNSLLKLAELEKEKIIKISRGNEGKENYVLADTIRRTSEVANWEITADDTLFI